MTPRPTASTRTVGPTVAAGIAKGLLDLAVAKGADRETLLARATLADADLGDPDNRVPLASYKALMKAAQELCRDPALALHFGEAVALTDLSVVALIGEATGNTDDALDMLNRFGRLIIEADTNAKPRFEYLRDAAGTWLVDNRADPNTFPELSESTFARMICWTRKNSPTPLVKAVQFTHPKPAYAAAYDRVLAVPVSFGCARNAILLDDGWMPPEGVFRPKPYVLAILRERAERLLEELESAKTLCARVEAAVAPMLHRADLSVDTVARQLGISRKTLYRKLKEEGATYASVVDGLRRDLALRHLKDENLSVNETAYLVGFSDPAAFSRAFKRWTGKSPSTVRPRA